MKKSQLTDELSIDTLDAVLVEEENNRLTNPFFGGISTVFVMMVDDHDLHIKSHLKRIYNPYTWFHIVSHLIFRRRKIKLGMQGLTHKAIFQAFVGKMDASKDSFDSDDSDDKSWN